MPIEDARLQELEFLAELEKHGGRREQPGISERKTRYMLAHLFMEGFINGIGSYPHKSSPFLSPEKIHRQYRDSDLSKWLEGQTIPIELSHKGHLRLAELREVLQTNRERDPEGLVISKRYLKRDIQIALINATAKDKTAFAMFDMNGLKTLNDTYSHDVGDQAIKIYLQEIASFTDNETITAYRGDGGDEVNLIIQQTGEETTKKLLTQILERLSSQTVRIEQNEIHLSAACGCIIHQGHKGCQKEILKATDEEMYRAKTETKGKDPSPSALAFNGEPVKIVE